MTELKKFFQSKGVITVITLLVLVLFLYSIGNLINVVLFTFIFAFLMNRFQEYISKYVNKAVKVDPRIILVFMYVVFLSALGLVFYKYLPIITMQIADLITEIQQFLRIRFRNGFHFQIIIPSVAGLLFQDFLHKTLLCTIRQFVLLFLKKDRKELYLYDH